MYAFLKVSMFVALFSLASCGDDSSSKKNAQASREVNEAVCEGVDCLENIDWKILIAGKSYPDHTRIVVNGIVVTDECLAGKAYAKIDRTSDVLVVKLKKFFVPRPGAVKIMITDLGECKRDDIDVEYLANDNVAFDVVKSTEIPEILINL